MAKVTVFGSGTCQIDGWGYKEAQKIGTKLGEAGLDLVTGGYKGIMEAVFKGAKDFPVEKIAIIDGSKSLQANEFATKVIHAENYLDRLSKLIDMGDGYIVLPGATGTLLELAAVWALKERNDFDKPIITVGEQWNEIVQNMAFYSEKILEEVDMVECFDDANSAINRILEYLM